MCVSIVARVKGAPSSGTCASTRKKGSRKFAFGARPVLSRIARVARLGSTLRIQSIHAKGCAMKTDVFRKVVMLTLVFVLISSAQAAGENRTMTGEVIVEPPTLIALGFEW